MARRPVSGHAMPKRPPDIVLYARNAAAVVVVVQRARGVYAAVASIRRGVRPPQHVVAMLAPDPADRPAVRAMLASAAGAPLMQRPALRAGYDAARPSPASLDALTLVCDVERRPTMRRMYECARASCAAAVTK